MMNCKVCGELVKKNTNCKVCGFNAYELPEGLPKPMVDMYKKSVVDHRAKYIGGMKVSLLSYYWEEVNGELKEKSRENILLCKDIETIELEEVKWCDTIFARQTAGEEKVLTIVVEKDGKSNTIQRTIVAPKTDGTWKVGFVLKPGFSGVLRVGDENNYTDTEAFSLV